MPACDQPLNIANERTFTTIKQLMAELLPNMTAIVPKVGRERWERSPTALFADKMVHFGGDEVELGCWTASSKIRRWLADHNMSPRDGVKYFIAQVAAHAAKGHGLTPVFWDDVAEQFEGHINRLPRHSVFQIWRRKANLRGVLDAGHRAVLSNMDGGASSWYLDLKGTVEGVHSNEPCEGLPSKLCDLVLGGEGCMWGENVDPSTLLGKLYPRLAAIAERLWSPRDTAFSELRLQALRCRLLRLGIACSPVTASGVVGAGSCAI